MLNKRFVLLCIKSAALITAAFTGALGILGKTLDDSGNVTLFGVWIIIGFVISLLIGLVISYQEYLIEDADERAEQTAILENTKDHQRSLEQINRTLHSIRSVEITISVRIKASTKELIPYKKMLDAELHNIKKIIDSGKKLEDVMIDTNVKINVGKDNAQYPICYLQMKWKSQLLPHLCSLKGEEKRNAERILAPIFNVLLTDKVQLEILRNPPPVPVDPKLYNGKSEIVYPPSMYLPSICDKKFFVQTLYWGENSSSLSYDIPNDTFMISTKVNNAIITYDNHKIISTLDLKNKSVILFMDRDVDFEIFNLTILFMKEESKNYSSLFHMVGKEWKKESGYLWACWYRELKQ